MDLCLLRNERGAILLASKLSSGSRSSSNSVVVKEHST
jgi:hypothetical protein